MFISDLILTRGNKSDANLMQTQPDETSYGISSFQAYPARRGWADMTD